MRLTLDDVKNAKFPIDKETNCYHYAPVDKFLDNLEVTWAELLNENERLKAQLAAAPEPSEGSDSASADFDAAGEPTAENAALRAEIASLKAELEAARNQQSSDAQPAPDGEQAAAGPERVVVTSSAEASPAVTRLVQLATEQAESVVQEADAEARRKLDEANRQVHELTVDAQTRADHLESEARINADQLAAEAKANSDQVNADALARRHQLFDVLEAEQQELQGKVGELRGFEADYRSTLVAHFQSHIDQLSQEHLEPAGDPGEARASATPRLDALLAESEGLAESEV